MSFALILVSVYRLPRAQVSTVNLPPRSMPPAIPTSEQQGKDPKPSSDTKSSRTTTNQSYRASSGISGPRQASATSAVADRYSMQRWLRQPFHDDPWFANSQTHEKPQSTIGMEAQKVSKPQADSLQKQSTCGFTHMMSAI